MDALSEDNRRGRWRSYVMIGLPLTIAAFFVVIPVVVLLWPSPGVRFTIVNHGPQRLRVVTLIVPGSVRVFGDMEPGQLAWRKTHVGEGGIAIEYSEENGHRVNLPVQGYLSNSDGEFVIELRDGKIEDVRDHTRVKPF